MVAALKIAPKFRGRNMLVIFPDSGYRYMSKIYSDEWMIRNNFMEAKE
jgi:hypothetical protein